MDRFPRGVSITAPMASGAGPALAMRVEGDGRGEGGTCWVLSLPYALCWMANRWMGSAGSFLHSQRACLAGHLEVTCCGPGHMGHPCHRDTDVQDDGAKAHTRLRVAKATPTPGFAPPEAAAKGQPPLSGGTWTCHHPLAPLGNLLNPMSFHNTAGWPRLTRLAHH